MDAAAAKASHARACDQRVYVRRYTGVGVARTPTDYATFADVNNFQAQEFAGAIVAGDRRAIVLVDPLVASGFTLPVLTSDKLVVRSKELAIIALDDNTRRVQDTLIAYEMQVRG